MKSSKAVIDCSPKISPKRSVLTFGTRNWTVRDIPPSHEAISIMKPADTTDNLLRWEKLERPPKFVGQKSIKLPSNKHKGLSWPGKVCHRACITELNPFKESQPPEGQLRGETSRGHDSAAGRAQMHDFRWRIKACDGTAQFMLWKQKMLTSDTLTTKIHLLQMFYFFPFPETLVTFILTLTCDKERKATFKNFKGQQDNKFISLR